MPLTFVGSPMAIIIMFYELVSQKRFHFHLIKGVVKSIVLGYPVFSDDNLDEILPPIFFS